MGTWTTWLYVRTPAGRWPSRRGVRWPRPHGWPAQDRDRAAPSLSGGGDVEHVRPEPDWARDRPGYAESGVPVARGTPYETPRRLERVGGHRCSGATAWRSSPAARPRS